MKWSLKLQAQKAQPAAQRGDPQALADIRAYIKHRRRNKLMKLKRQKMKCDFMKRMTTTVAALALALLATGCMTAKSVTKNLNNGIAQWIEALSKDTNSCRLRVNGFGVIIEFDRNGAGTAIATTESSAAGVMVKPMTTLRVEATK